MRSPVTRGGRRCAAVRGLESSGAPSLKLLGALRRESDDGRGRALPDARRVVVLEADTISRFSTERILRREDYWLFVTDDAAAAVRVASVSAIDLVLVDLALGRLEAVPQWQRRRGDVLFRGVPPSVTDGYAVLRPLHLDPASARFPVVTLKTDDLAVEPPPLCRFAVVQFLPRPWKAGGLVEGLRAILRETAGPAAGPGAESGAETASTARTSGARPIT